MNTVIKYESSVVIDETDVKIAQFLARGDTAMGIKKKLRKKFSARTIESRIARMRAKYASKNVAHLVATLMRLGVVK